MVRSRLLLIMLLLTLMVTAGCGKQAASSSTASTSSSETDKPISQSFFVFDTSVSLRIYDNRVTEQHFKDMQNILDDIEQKMSRTIPTSDIAKVNEHAGKQPVHVSDETFYVVKTAEKYSNRSNGAFNVAIGSLVTLWGIDQPDAHVPPQAEIDKALTQINYKDVVLDDTNKTIFLKQPGMILDLGGIAKGYAADRIAQYLTSKDFHSAIIDLSGNIFALGSKHGNQKWTIGIQDPNEQRGNQIGSMRVTNQTIVTSGIYERYFIENGVQYHHILDSKTGYPVTNNLNSVSIVTNHSIDADALSTTLFALGLDEGMKFVESMPDTEAIFITKEKKVYATSGMREKFTLTNPDYAFANK